MVAHRHDQIRAGLTTVLSPCIDQLVAAIVRARPHGDAESLHELRICARRLREALWIFRHTIPRSKRQRLRSDLRWLLRKTALTRDYDVLIDATLCKAARQSDEYDAEAIMRIAAVEQTLARQRTVSALVGKRCLHIVLDLKTFAFECRHHAKARSTDTGHDWQEIDGALLGLANTALQKNHKQPRKLSRSLSTLDSEGLHRLRIRIRAQHYRVELLSTLYPTKAVKRYLSVLGNLQRKLGAIHDLEVAQNLVQSLAMTSRARQTRDRFAQHCATLLSERVSRLNKLHLMHAGLKPFWT